MSLRTASIRKPVNDAVRASPASYTPQKCKRNGIRTLGVYRTVTSGVDVVLAVADPAPYQRGDPLRIALQEQLGGLLHLR